MALEIDKIEKFSLKTYTKLFTQNLEYYSKMFYKEIRSNIDNKNKPHNRLIIQFTST